MTITVKVKHPYTAYDKDIAVYAYNKHSGVFTRVTSAYDMEFCTYDTQYIVLVELPHDQDHQFEQGIT